MAGSRKRVRMTDDAPPHPRDGGHRDLKDKALNEIVPIRSAEAPLPRKTSLRRGTLQDEAAAVDPDSDLEAALKFGSHTEGEDSSDEEQAVERIAPEQLPKASKKKRKSSQQSESDTTTSVVYLGRIPRGFYEDQMREYFSQFGEVTRLRLSRNKKTGASKHYAFIEFAYPSVARIVQETMDNYLLAGHILVCKVLSPEQVHPKLWNGANRKYRPVPRARLDSVKRNQPKTEEQKAAILKRAAGRKAKKSADLAELGIEY